MKIRSLDAEPIKSSEKRLLKIAAIVTAGTLAITGAKVGLEHASSEVEKTINTSQDYKEYIAKPGDTLFDIAQRAEPGQDPRDVSSLIQHTIADREGVSLEDAAQLQPGEVVPLPNDSQIGQEIIVIDGGKK